MVATLLLGLIEFVLGVVIGNRGPFGFNFSSWQVESE